MFFELLIKLIVSIVSLSSIVVLTYSIFKIPIKDNDKQITLLGLFLGATNFYFKFVLESQYSFLILIFTFFVLIKLFKGYPIFFSLIVSLTGIIGAGIVDLIISYTAIMTKLSSNELMQTSSKHVLILNVCSAILCFLIAALLRKFNFGFSFIVSRYYGKFSLRYYNFIWLGILVVGGIIAELSVMKKDDFQSYGYILASLYIIFSLAIAYAAIQNKKSTEARKAAAAVKGDTSK